MEGKIPFPRSAYTHIICWMLLVFIWTKAVKSQMVQVQGRFKDLQLFILTRRQNKIFHSFKTFLYVCMYLFAIDKKSLKIVHFPPINKTK